MHSPVGIVLLAVCDRQSPIHRDSPIRDPGGPRPEGRKGASSTKTYGFNEMYVNVLDLMKFNGIL